MKLDMADFAVLAVGALILFLVGLCKEKGHQIRAELATKNIALRWAVYYVFAVWSDHTRSIWQGL